MSDHTFYVVKSIIALLATVLYLIHMARVRDLTSLGRRLRYVALLAGAVLLAYASTEQIREGVAIEGRNLGGMAFAGILTAAAVVSLWEDRRNTREGLPGRCPAGVRCPHER